MIANEEGDIYSPEWNPSTEQMRAYLAREVELCKHNLEIAKCASKLSWIRTGKFSDDRITLLHSWAIVLEAITGIRVARLSDPCGADPCGAGPC